jgi:hypothetical protein
MILYIFNLYIPAEQAGRQKTLDRMLASIPQIQSALNLLCMYFYCDCMTVTLSCVNLNQLLSGRKVSATEKL